MMNLPNEYSILVTCPKGMQPWLEREVRALGFDTGPEMPAGVSVDGSLADCSLLNLHLRVGHRVLFLLDRFKARSAQDLYDRVRNIPWEEHIRADGYVSVHSFVRTEAVNHSNFPNLKLKDALVDRFQDKFGKRPNTGPDMSRSAVFLHWEGSRASVYLDTTGEPLSFRGYRRMPHRAPMRETLAAAALTAADWPARWEGAGNFINPMCGSGTPAVEAVLMARNIAPGLLRSNFAFMHHPEFDKKDFEREIEQAKAMIKPNTGGIVAASDNDPEAVKAAETNAHLAGVDKDIRFAVHDFRSTRIPQGGGAVFFNPEYGMRLGEERRLEEVYSGIGDFFKKECGGYMGYIFTGNPGLAKKVGLRTKRKIPFYSAKLECRLLEYELYAGSRKAGKQGKRS